MFCQLSIAIAFRQKEMRLVWPLCLLVTLLFAILDFSLQEPMYNTFRRF